MKQYIVNVREVWIQPVRVKANNEEDAKQQVKVGKGELMEDALEYSHTVNMDSWTVEEVGE